MIVSTMPDFDADKVQPTCPVSADDDEFDEELEEAEYTRPYSPMGDDETFDRYRRRLESVHRRYLIKYMCEALYAAVKYRDSVVRETASTYSVQHTLVDAEDGSAISESELELDVDEADWSQREIGNAMKKLPYVLKRLHNLSILLHVHMLSMISAYNRAEQIYSGRRAIGYTRVTKVNDVVEQGVYLCDDFGNPTYQPAKSAKNLRVANAFRWLMNEIPDYPTYHVDVDNFLHYVDVLNIDILNDDMSKYDADFMSSLIVTTVTPAYQYDPSVYNALMGNGKTHSDNKSDKLDSTIALYRELCVTLPDLKAKASTPMPKSRLFTMQHWAIQIAQAFYQTMGVNTSYAKYKFIDGFLTYAGDICVIGTSVFLDAESPQYQKCPTCIISDLGYMIGLSQSMVLYGILIDNAYSNYHRTTVGFTKDRLNWLIWSD